jgi:hypothetical protein
LEEVTIPFVAIGSMHREAVSQYFPSIGSPVAELEDETRIEVNAAAIASDAIRLFALMFDRESIIPDFSLSDESLLKFRL